MEPGRTISFYSGKGLKLATVVRKNNKTLVVRLDSNGKEVCIRKYKNQGYIGINQV